MKNILKSILSIIILLLSGYLIYIIYRLNMLPNKYLFIFIGGILLLNLIGIITLFIKKIWIKIFTIISYLLLILISVLGIFYGSNTLKFLKNAFNNNNVEITTYEVLILKKNNYNINNIKRIGYLSEDNNIKEVDKKLKELKLSKNSYEDVFSLYNSLLTNDEIAILVDMAYYQDLEDEYDNFNDIVKSIYSFEVKEVKKQKEEKIEKLEPFSIYISGSDSRSNKIQAKSRSDVNMVLTINPDTKTVLMTSIPRDYFVQVHGQKGLKDKLTHSGIYGVDISRQTVEDLFDVKIDYSIKVGMNAVVELVDLVGGIDVNSDIAFNSSHIKGWKVKKGMNHFNGKQALAYSRERYAYASGDRHRIMNQQQVLEATLKKVTSDKALLTKYDKILTSLSDLYRTDIPSELVSLLVKMQISDMSGWTFISNSVSGADASSGVHVMPNAKLYVMIPYEKDVKAAHDKMIKVLNGDTTV